MLINLREASAGLRTLLGARHWQKTVNPLDYCSQSMGMAFERVNPESAEFKALMDYMASTSSHLQSESMHLLVFPFGPF